MEYLFIPAMLLVGFLFLYLYYLIFICSTANHSQYYHHEVRKPNHTFTNDEILSVGIDTRIESHRQELLNRRERNKRIEKTISEAEKVIRQKEK